MDEIVNKFSLAGKKSVWNAFKTNWIHVHIVLVDHLPKAKKEQKNWNKQEVQDIFVKTN